MNKYLIKCIVFFIICALFIPFSVAHSKDSKATGFKYRIDKSNVDQYKDKLPEGLYFEIKNWGYAINVYDTVYDFIPPKEYSEATEQNKGAARVNTKGGLDNYKGGLPFPDPKTGLEIMYDYDNRYQGYDHYANNYEMSIVSSSGKIRTMRGSSKFITPVGSEYSYKGINMITYPEDVAGLALLTFRYRDPSKKDDTWMYLPSIRRNRRISSAQRGDSAAGTDWTWDDQQGFDAKISDFNWNFIGKKEVFVPFHGPKNMPRRDGFLFLPEDCRYELREVFVVDGINKDKNYVYSRRRHYIDMQSYYLSAYDCWDRRGKLWKHAESSFGVRKDKGEIFINWMTIGDLIGHKSSIATNLIMQYNAGFKNEEFTTTVLQSLSR